MTQHQKVLLTDESDFTNYHVELVLAWLMRCLSYLKQLIRRLYVLYKHNLP